MVQLTKEEEEILNGKYGEAKAKALEVILRVAESLEATKLVKIKHAHISGVSYGTIGEAGLAFIKELVELGAKVSVPASVNPIGYDDEEPEKCGLLDVSREFLKGQQEILKALRDMGADLLLTCTPYYTKIFQEYNLSAGAHVAWGESSAVAYANSFLSLRTNREGGPLALMAAIAGRTYYYGMHLEENRIPDVSYLIPNNIEANEVTLSIIAEYITKYHESEFPPLLKIGASSLNDTIKREIAATLGASGNIPMIVIPGVTLEAIKVKETRQHLIDQKYVLSRLEELSPQREPDYYFIGCPHASEEELELLSKITRGNRLIITISKDVYRRKQDVVKKLERKGAKILKSTCLIVSRLKSHDISIVTNSYKAYFYLSKRGVEIGLKSINEIIKELS